MVTSPVTVRRAPVDDLAAGAAVRASALVDVIVTPAGMRTWLTNLPEEAAPFLLLAEAEEEPGRLVHRAAERVQR